MGISHHLASLLFCSCFICRLDLVVFSMSPSHYCFLLEKLFFLIFLCMLLRLSR